MAALPRCCKRHARCSTPNLHDAQTTPFHSLTIPISENPPLLSSAHHLRTKHPRVTSRHESRTNVLHNNRHLAAHGIISSAPRCRIDDGRSLPLPPTEKVFPP